VHQIVIVLLASPRIKLGSNIAPPTGLSAAVDYESVAPAVTRDDKLQREHDLQDLKFHISTLVSLHIVLEVFLYREGITPKF